MLHLFDKMLSHDKIDFATHSEIESKNLASIFAEYYLSTITDTYTPILLFGKVGAGKTFFTRSLLEHLVIVDPNNPFTSPSYTLIHEYDINRNRLNKDQIQESENLFHVDLYRIQNIEEIESLGILDLMYKNIVIIEWAEKILPILSPPYYSLHIEILTEHSRAYKFSYKI